MLNHIVMAGRLTKDPELRKDYEKQVAKTLERQRQLAEERKKAEEVSGQKLKEEVIEQPKQSDGARRSAVYMIFGIIAVALLAIYFGNRRKDKAA